MQHRVMFHKLTWLFSKDGNTINSDLTNNSSYHDEMVTKGRSMKNEPPE